MRVRFGEFALDDASQEILRDGKRIRLTPKAFDLLKLLIEHRPRLVSREELTDHIWPDVVVSPANLKNLVSELRRALDDHEREGRFIRTIHGRGYAFSDDAVEDLPDLEQHSSISLLVSGARYHLYSGENLIGRGGDCRCVIDDEEVSRRHARITVDRNGATVEDLESKNGTFLNGQRIEEPSRLSDLDRLELGTVLITVRIVSEETTRSAQ